MHSYNGTHLSFYGAPGGVAIPQKSHELPHELFVWASHEILLIAMLQHWEFTSSSWGISWETHMNFSWDWRDCYAARGECVQTPSIHTLSPMQKRICQVIVEVWTRYVVHKFCTKTSSPFSYLLDFIESSFSCVLEHHFNFFICNRNINVFNLIP